MIENLSKLDPTDILTLVVFPLFPVFAWGLFLFLVWRKRHPISLEPRPEVPWGAIDVAVVLGTMVFSKFLSQICAMFFISRQTGLAFEEINQQIIMEHAAVFVGTGIVFSILQLGFAIGYLRLLQKCDWADLGLSPVNWKKNLAIGLTAAIMIIPLVLLINVLLHALLKIQYSHQVMTMVRYSLLVTAFSTVIVAPWVEEFHFRVVLQGYLQRIYNLDLEKKVRIVQGDQRAEKLLNQTGKKNNSGLLKPSKRDLAQKIPWWPILVSAFLFAGVHAGQGAAPYALFLFAIGLGFLYRQTNSIIPCLMVHFLLNLWSFVALVYSLD